MFTDDDQFEFTVEPSGTEDRLSYSLVLELWQNSNPVLEVNIGPDIDICVNNC